MKTKVRIKLPTDVARRIKYNRKMKKLQRKNALKTERHKVNRSSQAEALSSPNPLKRKLAQMRDTSMKKHEAHIRKIEANTRMVEQNPEIAAKQADIEGKVKVAKAKASGKMAGYTAAGVGASNLGRGLIAEQNRDDEKDRKHEQEVIDTIFNNDESSSGLKEGVL